MFSLCGKKILNYLASWSSLDALKFIFVGRFAPRWNIRGNHSVTYKGVLPFLANCSEIHLLCVIFFTRLAVMTSMLLSSSLLPLLFGLPRMTLDSGSLLFHDPRMSALSNWDAVHFLHIAKHGYTHENNVVFYPFLPAVIRCVTWVTTSLWPLLSRLAPVTFYTSLINIFASSISGVLLRRITMATFSSAKVLNAARAASSGQDQHSGLRICNSDSGTLLDRITYLVDVHVSLSYYTSRCERQRGQPCKVAKLDEAVPRGEHGVHTQDTRLDAEDPSRKSPNESNKTSLSAGHETRSANKSSNISNNIHHRQRRNRKSDNSKDHDKDHNVVVVDVEQKKERMDVYRSIVGGAVLVWVISPSQLFSVVVYTESAFSLLIFLGIHLLINSGKKYTTDIVTGAKVYTDATARAATTSPAKEMMCGGSSLTSPCALVGSGHCECSRGATMASDSWTMSKMTLARKRVTATPRSIPLLTWEECVATLSFLVACTIRSNGFLCAGFLIYPLFLQLCFPYESGRQSRDVAPIFILPRRSRVAWRRLPARIAVVLCECILVFTPFLAMNFFGWYKFGVFLRANTTYASHSEIYGHSKSVTGALPTMNESRLDFLSCYRIAQLKFWNVSFLSSYSRANLPNVIIALPSFFTSIVLPIKYYFVPALYCARRVMETTQYSRGERSWCCQSRCGDRRNHDTHNRRRPSKPSFRPRAWLHCLGLRLAQCGIVLECLVISSNAVYFLCLSVLALTFVNVQVSNRFLAACPALYWFCGCEIAMHPRSVLTKMIIVGALSWNCFGIILFANNMPWT